MPTKELDAVGAQALGVAAMQPFDVGVAALFLQTPVELPALACKAVAVGKLLAGGKVGAIPEQLFGYATNIDAGATQGPLGH